MELDKLTDAVMEALASAGYGGKVQDTEHDYMAHVLAHTGGVGRPRKITCVAYENGVGSVTTAGAKWFGRDYADMAASAVRRIAQGS